MGFVILPFILCPIQNLEYHLLFSILVCVQLNLQLKEPFSQKFLLETDANTKFSFGKKRRSSRRIREYHPFQLREHQIKGSSLHQRLILNPMIASNYNYIMVGTQIIVINPFGRQFCRGY